MACLHKAVTSSSHKEAVNSGDLAGHAKSSKLEVTRCLPDNIHCEGSVFSSTDSIACQFVFCRCGVHICLILLKYKPFAIIITSTYRVINFAPSCNLSCVFKTVIVLMI